MCKGRKEKKSSLKTFVVFFFLLEYNCFTKPRWHSGKESAGSTPGSGRSPGVGNGNPFQYSSLENPMD